MPRTARIKGKSGIYHIILRGINRQVIFEDEDDDTRFLNTLSHYKNICGYEIYAYCLMSNHLHILIKEGIEPLAQIMRRICGRYVYWYNLKYERIGNLFQDRFKSEPVDDDEYALIVQRYVHQNPIKAGIEKDIGKYRWSSYNEYIKERNIIDISFILDLFNKDNSKAIIDFVEYNSENNNDKCLEIQYIKKIKDEEARTIILRVYKVKSGTDIQKIDKKIRDNYLRIFKKKYKLSIRQIERITDISRGVVQKA